MSLIRPFRAHRPRPEFAAEVASVPYDVIDSREARVLAAGKPRSFLHVCRPEIDLPEGVDEHDEEVYRGGVRALRGFIADGTLLREQRPSLYVYQQKMGVHVQAGLVCLCSVREYETGTIKRHELTRQDKEDDRTRLIDTIGAQTGPVFLAYRDSAAVAALVEAKVREAPEHDFTAPDGIRHTVWRIPEPAAWVQAFNGVPAAYIADGHHRAASAARVAHLRRARNPAHDGGEEYNWFLGVLFPASELKILPYNRIVADLQGLPPARFLDAVRDVFGLEENAAPIPTAVGRVSMYLGGRWYGLRCPIAAAADPVARLDVSVLQDRLLNPVLGIADVRTSKRIDFVGGIRGPDELVRRVDTAGGVAFSMFPVTLAQLMEIADAGQIMPPKSTWFEPKLRSGFFVHTL